MGTAEQWLSFIYGLGFLLLAASALVVSLRWNPNREGVLNKALKHLPGASRFFRDVEVKGGLNGLSVKGNLRDKPISEPADGETAPAASGASEQATEAEGPATESSRPEPESEARPNAYELLQAGKLDEGLAALREAADEITSAEDRIGQEAWGHYIACVGGSAKAATGLPPVPTIGETDDRWSLV